MDNAIGAIQNIAINSSEATGSSATQHIDLPSAQQWQVNQQDAAAFEQALNSPQQDQTSKVSETDSSKESSSFADDVLNKMQAMSASAAEKGELLERHIMKATQSLNPMDVVQANRMMSEYYLENLMTAKLVGNATKAVERLTSLN